MKGEEFILKPEYKSDNPTLDHTGGLFFGIAEELMQWLEDNNIAWSYRDDHVHCMGVAGPVQYREIYKIVILDTDQALLYKLTWG